MYIGEVASLSAHVVFTSPHSVCVKVVVTAENLCGGETRITNSGELWYVPLVASLEDGWKTPMVHGAPQLRVPVGGVAHQENNHALQSYLHRKHGMSVEEQCLQTPGCLSFEEFQASYNNEKRVSGGGTPAESEQTLCQMTLPGDCEPKGFCFGGFVMKLMDNAAGCSAFRHCRTNVVTVGISAMDFVHWIRLGDICTIHSRVVFASNKTLEIQVTAYNASGVIPNDDNKEDTLVAKGMFVLASLDENGNSIPVPPLKLETRNDYKEAYIGKLRYDTAKRARMAATSRPGKRLFSSFDASNQRLSTLSLARCTSWTSRNASLVPVGGALRPGTLWRRLFLGIAPRCLLRGFTTRIG